MSRVRAGSGTGSMQDGESCSNNSKLHYLLEATEGRRSMLGKVGNHGREGRKGKVSVSLSLMCTSLQVYDAALFGTESTPNVPAVSSIHLSSLTEHKQLLFINDNVVYHVTSDLPGHETKVSGRLSLVPTSPADNSQS